MNRILPQAVLQFSDVPLPKEILYCSLLLISFFVRVTKRLPRRSLLDRSEKSQFLFVRLNDCDGTAENLEELLSTAIHSLSSTLVLAFKVVLTAWQPDLLNFGPLASVALHT